MIITKQRECVIHSHLHKFEKTEKRNLRKVGFIIFSWKLFLHYNIFIKCIFSRGFLNIFFEKYQTEYWTSLFVFYIL